MRRLPRRKFKREVVFLAAERRWMIAQGAAEGATLGELFGMIEP
jgi:hypothetical protein